MHTKLDLPQRLPSGQQDSNIRKAIDFAHSIINKGDPWTDPDFPPNSASINKAGEYPSFGHGGLSWKRASEIYKNPVIFGEELSFHSARQGVLGDCYLVAMLSALAQDP